MRQWKSTFSRLFWNSHVNLPNETFVIVSARALISSNVAYCKTIKSIKMSNISLKKPIIQIQVPSTLKVQAKCWPLLKLKTLSYGSFFISTEVTWIPVKTDCQTPLTRPLQHYAHFAKILDFRLENHKQKITPPRVELSSLMKLFHFDFFLTNGERKPLWNITVTSNLHGF